MNENLNLVEILKDCPKGTKLYSTVLGDVIFDEIDMNSNHPIVTSHSGGFERFAKDGKLYYACDGECVLFPSKEQRDWSKFKPKKPKKPKFNPKTLNTFDRVLVRDDSSVCWVAQLFSHIIEGGTGYPYLCINDPYRYCIPYNDDTKHLVGTTEEAPEYYRYWEE